MDLVTAYLLELRKTGGPAERKLDQWYQARNSAANAKDIFTRKKQELLKTHEEDSVVVQYTEKEIDKYQARLDDLEKNRAQIYSSYEVEKAKKAPKEDKKKTITQKVKQHFSKNKLKYAGAALGAFAALKASQKASKYGAQKLSDIKLARAREKIAKRRAKKLSAAAQQLKSQGK